jgi:hypothetical protein
MQVVVEAPSLDDPLGLGQAGEPALIEAFFLPGSGR